MIGAGPRSATMGKKDKCCDRYKKKEKYCGGCPIVDTCEDAPRPGPDAERAGKKAEKPATEKKGKKDKKAKKDKRDEKARKDKPLKKEEKEKKEKKGKKEKPEKKIKKQEKDGRKGKRAE